jgi:hypothetical protein
VEGATAQRAVARVRDRGIVVYAACVVAVAMVAWPIDTVRPRVDSEGGWLAALAYAAQHRLQFGDQIAFSYGPLGFLTAHPYLYYPGLFVLSWLFAVLIQLLLAGVVVTALRRSLPLPLAAVIAAVALSLVIEPALALGVVASALLLTTPPPPRAWIGRVHTAGLGALTGILLLGKLNQGFELVLLASIALAATARRRDALAFVSALLATVVVCWFATGQTLADAWPYARNGAEVILGYAEAMSASDPAYRWTYPAAVALVALTLGLAIDGGRMLAPRRRWALVALCVVHSAFAFKEGFIRHDAGHLLVFFGELLVLIAVLPVRRSRAPALVAALAAAVAAYAFVGGGQLFIRTLDPYANVAAMAAQAQLVASAPHRDRLTAQVRADVASTYGIAPELVEAVGGRTVMLWPFAYGDVAYAYGLHLRPLPALEPYAAYTPALDRLGAELLASTRAPARMLRVTPAVAGGLDGRHPSFETPAATLAFLCRYRQIAVRPPWQLLARAGDRCGRARTLGTTVARWGAQVSVPPPQRPGSLVLVHISGTEPHGLEQIEGLLLRPPARWIELGGVRYRLVAATAAEGLLLAVPRGLDYPAPFKVAPNPSRIAVGRDGGQPGGRIAYRFEEVPLRPVPPVARAP